MSKPMELITLDKYLMGRDKLYPLEYTPDVENNAKKLLEAVNAFLVELGIKSATVTSGFRPAAINVALANSAKKSYHMLCLAVDILDNNNQDLAHLVASRPDLLRKYSLFLESPIATKGKNTNWVHLDLGARTDRPNRIFNP